MLYKSILVLASAIVGVLARPTQDVLSSSKPRPLVIWHGLGESLLPKEVTEPGESQTKVGLKVTRTPPRDRSSSSLQSPRFTPEYSYTRYISIWRRRKTDGLPLCVLPHCLNPLPLLTLYLLKQYGNVDDQVELVAAQLKAVSELSGGFDAIGFSQGSYDVSFPRHATTEVF